MAKTIKMCQEMILPREQRQLANIHAVEVNRANLVKTDSKLEGAVNSRKLWPNGTVLKVCFLEGDPIVQKRVEAVAHEWSKYGNIKFQFVPDKAAQIRIAFNPKVGSWSYIGVDSTLATLMGGPSMNLGWLKPTTPQAEYNRVVLHEFGHAIGLYHEHLSPEAKIPWDEKKVIEYYAKTNGWTEAYIRSNVLAKPYLDKFTRFDDKSIMLYAVDKALTLNGYSTQWNSELSDLDKKFVAECYPFNDK